MLYLLQYASQHKKISSRFKTNEKIYRSIPRIEKEQGFILNMVYNVEDLQLLDLRQQTKTRHYIVTPFHCV